MAISFLQNLRNKIPAQACPLPHDDTSGASSRLDFNKNGISLALLSYRKDRLPGNIMNSLVAGYGIFPGGSRITPLFRGLCCPAAQDMILCRQITIFFGTLAALIIRTLIVRTHNVGDRIICNRYRHTIRLPKKRPDGYG